MTSKATIYQIIVLCFLAARGGCASFVGTRELAEAQKWRKPCSTHYVDLDRYVSGCTPVGNDMCAAARDTSLAHAFCRLRSLRQIPKGNCDRVLQDNFLTTAEVEKLIDMAERGMAKAAGSKLGPTIMDVNSGWVLSSGQETPTSIYRDGALYAKEEYDFYRSVITRLKAQVELNYNLNTLYFTTPTFITREVGAPQWRPRTPHDEYWHPHVDKNNTDHYDYSGLVYLSTHEQDFTGGLLHFYHPSSLDCSYFMDPVDPSPCRVIGDPELEVAPRAGRLITFGSGLENPHRVTPVKQGTRYVLSFWFTCDSRKEMRNFLDGKLHGKFEGNEL
jgi:hypothetical protein